MTEVQNMIFIGCSNFYLASLVKLEEFCRCHTDFSCSFLVWSAPYSHFRYNFSLATIIPPIKALLICSLYFCMHIYVRWIIWIMIQLKRKLWFVVCTFLAEETSGSDASVGSLHVSKQSCGSKSFITHWREDCPSTKWFTGHL